MSGAIWAIFMMTFNLPTNTKTSAEQSSLIRPASTRPSPEAI